MIEVAFREKMQPVFNQLGKILIFCKLSPNAITVLSFLTGILSGLFVSIGQPILAIIFLWTSGLFDVLDGTVARLTKNSQKIGAYIDLISDRVVESAVIFGFAIFAPQHYLAYIIFLIAVMMHFSTFIVAGTLFENKGPKSIHYDNSIIERG